MRTDAMDYGLHGQMDTSLPTMGFYALVAQDADHTNQKAKEG